MKLVWLLGYLISLGIAGYIGYRVREPLTRQPHLSRDYLIGLNFLLNEETDKAVDVFVKLLEVDSDTIETHWAVGKLFRRRGEVDRAIRIHQNLIARPQLDKVYREQSLYELGQDYLSAGVLDRAERIFLELVPVKSHSALALRALVDIYQQEKDWEKAIRTASHYEAITKQSMQRVIAHYYCELAEMACVQKKYQQATHYLEKAIAVDHTCVRASLLQATLCMEKSHYQVALNHLKQVKERDPHFLSEMIELLSQCYEKLNQEEELMAYLQNLLHEYPHMPIIFTLAERIRKQEGDKVAARFVADHVRRYPSLRGLSLFVNLYIAHAVGRVKEDLHILQNLMQKLLANKPDYQCHSCGFSGKSLHWQCPGCKQWGTVKSVYHLEESY